MEYEETEEQKLDLFVLLDNILKEVRRFWWLGILLVAICAGGLAVRQHLSYTPNYTASASFTVKVANPLYASISTYNVKTAEQMATTFPYILTSGVLQERIKEHLGISSVPSIQVSASSGSNLLTLSVTSTDPQLSYDVLNAVITYYPEIAEFVVGSTVLVLLDESGIPTQPANSEGLAGAAKKGALLGAALWAALIVVLAALKNTIHNEDELKQILNSPCLGQIPTVKPEGGNDYPLFHHYRNTSGFAESVRLLRLHLEKKMTEASAQVLLVSSAIPGEGKTTVSINLAAALAKARKKVLLIDCDLRNPSVANALGVHSEHTLADFLKGDVSIKNLMYPTTVENLMIISSNNIAENDIHLLSNSTMSQLIQASRKFFDYVILDTPPCSLLADAAEVATLADCGLLVIRQSFASRDQILEGVQHLGDCELPIIGCVLNCMNRGFSSGYGYKYGYDYSYQYEYGKE